MKITSEWLNDKSACKEGLEWFDKHFTEGREVTGLVDVLLNEDKLDWANWLITNVLSKEDNVRYAIFAARKALYIFEKQYPGDERPHKAIEAAEEYLRNPTDAARAAASDAASDAAWAARAAASDAARAAASDAARAAAGDAAGDAAWAAWAAVSDAAWAARAAASDAARAAAGDAAWVVTMRAILKYGLSLIRKKG